MKSFDIGIKIGILLILVFPIITRSCSNKKYDDLKVKTTELEQMYKVANDSMITYRNYLNQESAKVGIFKTTSFKYFNELQTKDVEINKLKSLVKSYEDDNKKVTTALVLANQTVFRLRDSLTNIIGYTKSPNDSIVYPIYNRSFSDPDNKWIDGIVKMGKDTFDIKVKFKNEYEIANYTQKQGWFKEVEYTEVKNLNPYTETKSITSYKIEKPKVRTFNKIIGASIITFVATLLIFN